jgi:MFS family permease
VQGLQWVPSAYLLTYGGFMLLGGRAADLLGRRRILVAGTLVIGVSSLVGGFAGSAGVLVGARLVQGLGAAMMLPAALSILTTTFKEGKDRHTAVGAWGAIGGLSAAAGVLLGGLLTAGPPRGRPHRAARHQHARPDRPGSDGDIRGYTQAPRSRALMTEAAADVPQ